MFYADIGMKIMGKFGCNPADQPVLYRRGLNSQPTKYDQCDQYQQNGPGYFPELFQGFAIIGLQVKVGKHPSNTNSIPRNGFSVVLRDLFYKKTIILGIRQIVQAPAICKEERPPFKVKELYSAKIL